MKPLGSSLMFVVIAVLAFWLARSIFHADSGIAFLGSIVFARLCCIEQTLNDLHRKHT